MKRLGKFLLLLLLVLVAVVMFAPWKQAAERVITHSLTVPGLPTPQVEVESLGLRGIKLARLEFPGLAELTGAEVAFSPWEIFEGRIEEIHLASLTLSLSQDDKGEWHLPQMEASNGQQADQHAFVPPWQELVIDAGTLRIRGQNATADIPFSGSWQTQPQSRVTLQTQAFTAQIDQAPLSVESAKAEMHQTEKGWEGTWTAHAITSTGGLAQLGAVSSEGTLLLAGQSRFDMSLRAPQEKLVLALQGQWSEDGALQLKLREGRLKTAQGGVWQAQPASLPLGDKAVWNLRIRVSHQPVAELLALMGQEKVEGTGMLQGEIPLRVEPYQGRITVGQAELRAIEEGRLSLQGGLLPAGGQVENVNELLSDFRYEVLTMSLSGALDERADGQSLSAHLVLEGNNPAVYDGRAVKLNINLRGDLASLLRHSLMPINDPQQWMNEGK